MGNKLLILICVAVAVIVVLWLAHFILGIRKTKRFYQEELKRRSEKNINVEQKGNENENDQN